MSVSAASVTSRSIIDGGMVVVYGNQMRRMAMLQRREQTDQERHRSFVGRSHESVCEGCVYQRDMRKCGEARLVVDCGGAGYVLEEVSNEAV